MSAPVVVIPYFGYARQDRSFFPGGAGERARDGPPRRADGGRRGHRRPPLLPDPAGVQQTVVRGERDLPGVARLLREHPIDLLVSPDKGDGPRQAHGAFRNLPWVSLDKRRIDSEHVELALPENSTVPLDGRNVAIIDDVISTGGTIVEAARLLSRHHAASVSAACTHGLFLRDAFERIKAVTHHMYSTDTLDNPAEKVSVAPDIAQILRRNLGVS